jgi:hypothetical protein
VSYLLLALQGLAEANGLVSGMLILGVLIRKLGRFGTFKIYAGF